MSVSFVIVIQIKHVRHFKPGDWLGVTHGDFYPVHNPEHVFLLFLIKLGRNKYATYKCPMRNEIKFHSILVFFLTFFSPCYSIIILYFCCNFLLLIKGLLYVMIQTWHYWAFNLEIRFNFMKNDLEKWNNFSKYIRLGKINFYNTHAPVIALQYCFLLCN